MLNKEELVIGLLVGGASPERPVSKMSGASIYKALIKLGYKVVVIDPAYGVNQLDNVEDYFSSNDFHPVNQRNYIDAINLPLFDEVNLAFIGLHGKWGEDGTLQSLLEMRGIKYTGSGVLASALAMDKMMSKTIFRQNGISVHDGFTVTEFKYKIEDVMSRIKSSFGFPAVVKPNDQGSTFGLTICSFENEIEDALKNAFKYSDTAIIETFVPGRELTVGIIDGKPLPVLEIKPKHELYDYECKYTTGMSEYIVPAPIPEEIFLELQRESVLVYNSLGCKGYARVDFKLTPGKKFYCFELNTLPGMTSTSLLPKMAKAAGISFEELIDKIVALSFNGR